MISERTDAAVARLPRLAGRGLVALYRYTLAPLIGPRCRHLPSCSDYADEAIARFGLWAGGWMALARILRCHPLGTHGLDFVPADVPAGALVAAVALWALAGDERGGAAMSKRARHILAGSDRVERAGSRYFSDCAATTHSCCCARPMRPAARR